MKCSGPIRLRQIDVGALRHESSKLRPITFYDDLDDGLRTNLRSYIKEGASQ
jgi:hypothetical protein